jgi:hypothetical protein
MNYGEKGYWGRQHAIQEAADRLIEIAGGKEKCDHIEALAHALGTTLGSPARSLERIERDIEEIACMILEAALAHRNWLIEHGPWHTTRPAGRRTRVTGARRSSRSR